MNRCRSVLARLSQMFSMAALVTGFLLATASDLKSVSGQVRSIPPTLNPDVIAKEVVITTAESSSLTTVEKDATPPSKDEEMGKFPPVGSGDMEKKGAESSSAASNGAAKDTIKEAVESPSNPSDKVANPENKAERNDQAGSDAKSSDSKTEPISPERLEELLSLVTDNTTKIIKREMPAYWALVDLAKRNEYAELKDKSRVNPRFNDFYSNPVKRRGELITITMNVRRVLPYPVSGDNSAGVKQVYELWGWTEEAKAWMYCAITPELPPNFPKEGDVKELAEITGYFFKMQAYQPGDAAPDAKPLAAPLLIGKVKWVDRPIANASNQPMWPLYIFGGFAALIMLRLALRMKSMTRSTTLESHYRRRSLEFDNEDVLALSIEDFHKQKDEEMREAVATLEEKKP